MSAAIQPGGGASTTTSTSTIDTRPFLLLLGQIVAVLILSWAAGISDRIGYIVIAFLAVLWLLFIMNRSDLIAQWGAKLGMPQANQKVVVH